MPFAANESKTFSIYVTANKRVTVYTSIRTQVAVTGATASDTTTIQNYTNPSSASSNSSRGNSSSSSSNRTQGRSVLFREVADASEVLPGGSIRYTLYVQNVLLTPVSGVTITDRFDPSIATVVDPGNAMQTSASQLQWTLPTLQPGQVWKTVFIMKVNSNVPANTSFSNIATINGTDLGSATLNETVSVGTTSVVTDLPTTGASFDLLFLLLIVPLAAGAATLQRIVR